MNIEPLEESYFKWLAVQVVDINLTNPRSTNWELLKHLHMTEFFWNIKKDDNRVADGKELRYEFLGETSVLEWEIQGCSFLEMLIGLSRRLAFQTEDISVAEWFWHLMDNVGLRISDHDYQDPKAYHYVKSILHRINNRTYKKNGEGGLFPLHNAYLDQTRVELWDQMNYYLLERG